MSNDFRQSYRFPWERFGNWKKFRQSSTFFYYVGNYFAQKRRKRIRWIWLGSTIMSGSFVLAYMRSSYASIYCSQEDPITYKHAINKSRDILKRLKDEVGAPGIVVGVSVNGKNVWQEGLGYADVENRVPCTKDTVMRIASISKSLTMAVVAKLWEDGKLDFDKPVKEYVPFFPEKTYDGKKVDITCRHLVSHLSGIRHYDKSVYKNDSEKSGNKNKEEKNTLSSGKNQTDKNENNQKSEFELREYFIKDKYESVKDALDLFKDDPLVHKPGTKFLYTTHGWTLLSAVIEALVEKPFSIYMCQLFKHFGMANTFLDTNDAIIYHRSRFYCKDKKGRLQNTPYVDNSYKWAGGGFLSTVGDLLRFGNIMLYSLQYRAKDLESENKNDSIQSNELEKSQNDINTLKETVEMNSSHKPKEHLCNAVTDNTETICNLPGYLKDKTVKMIWLPVENTATKCRGDVGYGMGWSIISQKQDCGYCRESNFRVLHTGGAIGASSVLLILPRQCNEADVVDCKWKSPPQGVIVGIVTNLQGISLMKTATQIAKIFQESFLNR